ncbi:hypothetical protein NLJ89_g9395 [Agrocybe chaxingu]|uniref:N-acetyltransferase domain-containing protein n=1 Tax=Agrocybe chaxingu TaxID=84603 RepID=A0A9W8JTD3_9AGAR|nr:hypothetical protein NLJ89_g9395 [Agrocybe chaxingu]
MGGSEHASSEDSDYVKTNKSRHKRPRKRRRRAPQPEQEPVSGTDRVALIVASLLEVLRNDYADEDDAFDDLVELLLEECMQARNAYLEALIDLDETGRRIRLLRREEGATLIDDISKKDQPSYLEAMILRKLKLEQKKQLGLKITKILVEDPPLTPLPPSPSLDPPPVDPSVLDALYDIQTTPFHNSFLSRFGLGDEDALDGAHGGYPRSLHAGSPTTPKVHDLLERSFWTGIDATDSLDYEPKKVTVVAMFKKIVAIMSSPRETYITFLAVKSGWDKSQIGRTMLYHLITMNPHKDITLHVSANSSAMLLYNQFGFKAEEFVAGFYSKYLDPQSRASTNAFKLRLRKL